MLASGSSSIVLTKAAAGPSHVSTHNKTGRLLAPRLLHSFISCAEGLPGCILRRGRGSAGVNLGGGKGEKGGGGLRHGQCGSAAHAFFPDSAVGVIGLKEGKVGAALVAGRQG